MKRRWLCVSLSGAGAAGRRWSSAPAVCWGLPGCPGQKSALVHMVSSPEFGGLPFTAHFKCLRFDPPCILGVSCLQLFRGVKVEDKEKILHMYRDRAVGSLLW